MIFCECGHNKDFHDRNGEKGGKCNYALYSLPNPAVRGRAEGTWEYCSCNEWRPAPGSPPDDSFRIGATTYNAVVTLLCETVKRLAPDYQGPWDGQALVQYLETLVLEGRNV